MKKGDLIVIRGKGTRPKYIYCIEKVVRNRMLWCWRAYEFKGSVIVRNHWINEELTAIDYETRKWKAAEVKDMTVEQLRDVKIRFPNALERGWDIRERYNPFFNVHWMEVKTGQVWELI